MRSKNNAKAPRAVIVFWRPENHDYLFQSTPEKYDLFASYLFENEVKARWRALDSPSNTNPAALLSMKYGLKYVPIGSEMDCSNARVAIILDEASAKSFEVLYFAERSLLDVNRNADDLYDIGTMLASINDADEIIQRELDEKFNADYWD
ncbi:Uncharacterised protein [uncultured archaeon]|nr:Uncharacterised protein [uncultured archaeon]